MLIADGNRPGGTAAVAQHVNRISTFSDGVNQRTMQLCMLVAL